MVFSSRKWGNPCKTFSFSIRKSDTDVLSSVTKFCPRQILSVGENPVWLLSNVFPMKEEKRGNRKFHLFVRLANHVYAEISVIWVFKIVWRKYRSVSKDYFHFCICESDVFYHEMYLFPFSFRQLPLRFFLLSFEEVFFLTPVISFV